MPFFWLPEDTLELRCRRDHVLYDVWQKQGFIQTTEGNVIHYGFIEKFIERLGETYHIREIAYDRWNATQMVQNLEDMGFTMVPFGQGFKDMSPPSKELFKLLMEGNIIPWRQSRSQMGGQQRRHAPRSCGKHQAGQRKIRRKD